MPASQSENKGGIQPPSEFMRKLRPENYSDTVEKFSFRLDAATFGYTLNSITARNETHEFELFARKLCERTICPFLKPATGPEGGGDSKADSETYPVSEKIATLAYVGEPNTTNERWAFAISAQKTWSRKVRSDVKGIVDTNREYRKIFFITSRLARARDRARIEDELSKKYGLIVTILDQTWIIEQIITNNRRDLAFNYLGVGEENPSFRLGPSDYSRKQQLEDIESSFDDPGAFLGMEEQRVSEALVAAKLSRSIELPRFETTGRFMRAVRLADKHGTLRQRIAARYEWIWTEYWWFDEIGQLREGYDEIEALALQSVFARDLDCLCTLLTLLSNQIFIENLSVSETNIVNRIKTLVSALEVLANDKERPNNALEAKSTILSLQVCQALLSRDIERLSGTWPKFSDILDAAKLLGDFPAEGLIQKIEAFGAFAKNDASYVALVDKAAEFVEKRAGEAQGALVLLKHAEQLGSDSTLEIIRLLGRAAPRLRKNEFAHDFARASYLLAAAYRSEMLLWAARATVSCTLSSIASQAEDDGLLPVTIVPALVLFAETCVQLSHIPDALTVIAFIRGCLVKLPLDEESKDRCEERLQEFDGLLSHRVLLLSPDELEQTSSLPQVFERLGLSLTHTSMLYALGYEKELREIGLIPKSNTPEKVNELFSQHAARPTSAGKQTPILLNRQQPHLHTSFCLGIRIQAEHDGSESGILAAEAIIGSVEAFFATTLEHEIQPHAEYFLIRIENTDLATSVSYKMDLPQMQAVVRWPQGTYAHDPRQNPRVQTELLQLSAAVFGATCLAHEQTRILRTLLEEESVFQRIAMISVVAGNREIIFGETLSRLEKWAKLAAQSFPPKASRPSINPSQFSETDHRGDEARSSTQSGPTPANHRDRSVRSVIDIHTWEAANWLGAGFTDWGPTSPPGLALIFSNESAARGIFERWRDRFGESDERNEIYISVVRELDTKTSSTYHLIVTSRPEKNVGHSNTMSPARICSVHVESSSNLDRFVGRFDEHNSFFLLPATLAPGKNQKPEFHFDLSIFKTEITVKHTKDIEKSDIESIVLQMPEREKRK